MARVAVITADVLGEAMAGPAIRAVNIATQLSTGHEVALISTRECTIARDGFSCTAATGSRALRAAVGDADVIVIQGYVSYFAPWLLDDGHVLVVDLYDPIHLEQFEQLGDRGEGERQAMLDLTTRVLNEQLLRGDFFVCASEDQRRLWIGHLAALGRVNDRTYRADPSLRSLIDVAPFGMPATLPRRTGPGIRGVVEGIGAEDKLVLWAGGVYNWFDPLTLIRAIDRLRRHRPDVRLYFLGMKHPNPDVPAMRVAYDTRALADELGLTGVHVFFNEGWVKYDERQNYLLDADLGVSTHFDHLETAFSFRTRILDYLWAGLPVVATGGDAFATVLDADGVGATVPEQDIDALVDALDRLLYDLPTVDAARAAVAVVRDRFTWANTLAPLVDFCAEPSRSADADLDLKRIAKRPVMPRNPLLRAGLRALLLLRRGGPRLVARKLAHQVARSTDRLT